jgi:hypothetical protein
MPWERLDQNIGKTPNDEGFDRIYKEGARMTEKGNKLCSKILFLIPTETSISKCSIASGKFNYAVFLKGLSFAVKLGIEQRDAIKIGPWELQLHFLVTLNL